MSEIITALEKSALKAWPALEEVSINGWVLRFSKGYTKRANSVNVLWDSSLGLSDKVKFCEHAYQQRGLPTIFRITPLSPPGLDTLLDGLSYSFLHPTWVMTLDISHQAFPKKSQSAMVLSEMEAWIDIFENMNDKPLQDGSIHKEIIGSIKEPCLYASLQKQAVNSTCGLGVLDGIYFGLFDIITHPTFRNQGLGSILVNGMLGWAKENGALRAYLQIMENNQPGFRLYRKAGFKEFYKYWYRVTGD